MTAVRGCHLPVMLFMKVIEGLSMSIYQHLQPTISSFFRSLGLGCEAQRSCEVVYSSFGRSNGPDLSRFTLVGEIKDKLELERDLSSRYWSSWNNPKASHGGKAQGYRLADDLPASIPTDGQIKGWIAVVFGQMNYQRTGAGLPDGWLIVEDYATFSNRLREALEYLKGNNKIRDFVISEYQGLGFVHVYYFEQECRTSR